MTFQPCRTFCVAGKRGIAAVDPGISCLIATEQESPLGATGAGPPLQTLIDKTGREMGAITTGFLRSFPGFNVDDNLPGRQGTNASVRRGPTDWSVTDSCPMDITWAQTSWTDQIKPDQFRRRVRCSRINWSRPIPGLPQEILTRRGIYGYLLKFTHFWYSSLTGVYQLAYTVENICMNEG